MNNSNVIEIVNNQWSYNSEVITYMMLHDGTTVPKHLYDKQLELVRNFIKCMLPGHRYLLETICGNSLWNPLSRYQRALAGKCMVHFISEGMIPLVFADTGRKRTKMYQLIG